MAKLQKEIKQTKPFRSRKQEAVLAIVRTADILKRRWGRIVEDFGVTGQQYNVLRILRGSHPEPLPTMEIASRMIENTPGITGLIDRLEEKGLVKRARDAEDRRCSRCTITEKGLALLHQMDPVADRNEEEGLAMLDGEDVDRLIEILEVVRSHHS